MRSLNIVKSVYVKFNYDRLPIDKVLGNFRKSDKNNKKKNNKIDVCIALEDPFLVQKCVGNVQRWRAVELGV